MINLVLTRSGALSVKIKRQKRNISILLQVFTRKLLLLVPSSERAVSTSSTAQEISSADPNITTTIATHRHGLASLPAANTIANCETATHLMPSHVVRLQHHTPHTFRRPPPQVSGVRHHRRRSSSFVVRRRSSSATSLEFVRTNKLISGPLTDSLTGWLVVTPNTDYRFIYPGILIVDTLCCTDFDFE